MEVIACSESFPMIGHMPNSDKKRRSYGCFKSRPIGLGEGARSGPQRFTWQRVFVAHPIGRQAELRHGRLLPDRSRGQNSSSVKRPIGRVSPDLIGRVSPDLIGRGLFWAVFDPKTRFSRGGTYRCPNTPFIVLFIIIHILEREKAIDRESSWSAFCNL